MKRNISSIQFIGFIFVSVGGTLLHYLYEWSGDSFIVAVFSGVNESTWEHMKLLYFPLFIFSVIEWHFLREHKNFWWVKLFGTILGLLLIPVIFYTYNGSFGKSPDWFNIAIFFISAAVVFILEALFLRKNFFNFKKSRIALFILMSIGVSFVYFTFKTPNLPIFKDPIDGSFGIG